MIKLYELEDEIRFFIKNNITEFYVEDLAISLDRPVDETFKSLIKFIKTDDRKIELFYETKCPHCKNRIKEYTDILSVGIEEMDKCDSCGEFKKEKDNTYIFFKATTEWVEAIKIIEEREAIKAKKKALNRIKNETNIIEQLNRVFNTFENIPEGGLSIEGKIIKSQIKTYLESKKEAI